MNERIKVYSPDLNCVYCHEDLGVGIPSVSCGCGATQHISCVDELGNSDTCGSCTYVFNSPEAKQLGDEHFKKPESLEEMVEESVEAENTDETNLGTHAKALSYMVKSATITAGKGVGIALRSSVSLVVFAVKGLYKTHLAKADYKSDEELAMYCVGTGLVYWPILSYLAYVGEFGTHPDRLILGGCLSIFFGLIGGAGAGLASMGVCAGRKFIRDKYNECLNQVKENE